jgi:thiosulfate reductase cytochrome b subunit
MSEALYLYPLWLRLWHWINALLFLTLIVTGVSMHYSDAGWLLPFETAMPVHNASGILLTLSWIGFVIGNLKTDNGRHYRIYWKTLPRELWQQSRYYAYGIFVNEPHPFHVSSGRKLNALQTLSYIGVMYALMPLLILSGWGFLLSALLPETLFGIGSIWVVAMLHLASSWLLAVFLLVHLYIITTGETVLINLKAMLSGWHRVS